MTKYISRAAVAAAAIALGVSGANAATPVTATMQVSANVVSACTLNTNPLNFGNVTTTTTGNTQASATLIVNCSQGVSYSIGIDNGSNFNSSGAANYTRQIASGNNKIPYGIFSDAACSVPWDNAGNVVSNSGSGQPQPLIVCGILPPINAAAPGVYTDTVNVSINY